MSRPQRAGDTRLMRPELTVVGLVAIRTAIGTSLLLGTFGGFAVGFGMMTDCTNNYSCSQTGCAPCATTSRWITAGGITQWVLAGTGAALLIRALRRKPPSYLAVGGVALLAVSVMAFVGTTWGAQESYCQPGTPGYDRSYCSIEA